MAKMASLDVAANETPASIDATETTELAPVIEATPATPIVCGKNCKTEGYCQNCGKTAE